MPKLLAIALSVAITLLPAARSSIAQTVSKGTCAGITVAALEQRLPSQTERYALDRGSLKHFIELWHSAKRPILPTRPERVLVYSLPEKPFLISYQSGGCVIASLYVERGNLWRWLAPRIGWTA